VASTPFVIADVFSDRPLAGNQLAVFTDASAIPEALLQPLAREMGFSETVFVLPPRGDGAARIRIFTPANELPFAGHPVLGTAVTLAITRSLDDVVLETGRGDIPVALRERSADRGFGVMRQPLPTVAPHPDPGRVLAALGVAGSTLPVEVYDNGVPHVFVTLPDEAAVARLDPDLSALTRLAREDGQPIVGFNCIAGNGRAWKTRMFAPADGVSEDPATGSAAGPLACHLARHGRIRFGEEIEISQGVEIGRPSTLFATAHGSEGMIAAVNVGGSALLVADGSFRIG
jgi:trans-2,3-dihydro-3-hydroxyanthranilate isomerase